MKTNRAGLLGIIWAALVTLLGFLIVIQVTVMDRGFYHDTQAKYQIERYTNLRPENMDKAMAALLDYIEDKRADLKLQLEFNDRGMQEVFNEKSILHMQDVKQLYQLLLVVILTLAVIVTLMLVVFFFLKWLNRYWLGTSLLKGLLITAALIGLLALYIAVDFENFWTLFHKIAFSNDLWLLDMNTDVLLQLVPLELFNDLVIKIVLRVFLFMSAQAAVGFGLVQWAKFANLEKS
ncbi:MAG: TIGR01906 family membrane protein [Erysipelotrichaceae bacterium]|jgi:integral membrane protein (TIGR01906 family)|nr:TIGR01906 family membrane protein [Erysipelotrichaceae bacterium]